MTVKDSHFVSSSDTFKPQKLVQTLMPYVFLFCPYFCRPVKRLI